MKDKVKATYARIEELGLESNIAELEVKGYTVVPPEKVAEASHVAEMRETLLQLAREESEEFDKDSNFRPGFSYTIWYPIIRQSVFARNLLNEVALVLSRYLLGESMVLNNSLGFVKGRTSDYYRVHTDSLMIPEPLPSYTQIVNCSFLLTDYTVDRGCIGVVPGSHRLYRHPTPTEEQAFDMLEPIEAPAGSLLILPACTWHGAFPNETDSLRVALVQAFSRVHIAPSIDRSLVTEETIQQYPPQFARLLGRDLITGFGTQGPDMSKYEKMYLLQRDKFA